MDSTHPYVAGIKTIEPEEEAEEEAEFVTVKPSKESSRVPMTGSQPVAVEASAAGTGAKYFKVEEDEELWPEVQESEEESGAEASVSKEKTKNKKRQKEQERKASEATGFRKGVQRKKTKTTRFKKKEKRLKQEVFQKKVRLKKKSLKTKRKKKKRLRKKVFSKVRLKKKSLKTKRKKKKCLRKKVFSKVSKNSQKKKRLSVSHRPQSWELRPLSALTRVHPEKKKRLWTVGREEPQQMSITSNVLHVATVVPTAKKRRWTRKRRWLNDKRR